MVLSALILVLAGQLELRPERGAVTAGDAVEIAISAKADGKPLSGSPVVTARGASVGSLAPAGPGSFSFRLKTAESEDPSVALIHARLKGHSAFLAVPISGRRTVTLTAPPRAVVTLQVAERSFGPFQADAQGQVRAQVLLPPGIRNATAQIVERRGARTEQDLELAVNPFPRMRVVALDKAEASFETPLELAVFAVDESGTPLRRPPSLSATVEAGRVAGWSVAKDGSARLRYLGADKAGAKAKLAISWLGEPTQQGDALTVESVAGKASRVEITALPAEVVAGAGTSVELQARLVDAKGNLAAPHPVAFSLDLGVVEKQGPFKARMRAPDFFEGKTEVVVRAVAGDATGEERVLLRSSTATRADVLPVKEKLRPGDPAQVVLTLADRFGNPVTGAKLEVKADRGAVKEIKELGAGKYALSYAVAVMDGPGPLDLEVRPVPGELVARSRLDVLPHQPTWGMTVGLVALGQSNFALSTGLGLRLDLGLRLGSLPLELLLQGEGRMNRPASSPIEDAFESVITSGASGRVGLRFTMPLFARAALVASASAGAQYIQGTVKIDSYGVSQTATSLGPAFGGSLGVSYAVGPGRLLLEAQALNAMGQGLIRGNFGGFGGGLGYVLELGGAQ